MVTVGMVLGDVMSQLAELSANGGRTVPGLSTGLSAVDAKINGMNKSDLLLLAARPGMGKTSMALNVALNAAKVYYEEKHDKGSFIKNIISDNILISDIYMRAKELHVAAEVPRGVFVIRPVDDRVP